MFCVLEQTSTVRPKCIFIATTNKKVCRTNARYTASYYAREHVDINKGLAAVLVATEEEDPSLLSQMQELGFN